MSVKRLPFVSIITPSFNQGKFIKETIESVLSQNFKDIEHIVVDGGSTDETLTILKEYSKLDERLRFISEPDNGQSHAINKGLKMAKGNIIGWLNSDDTYLPGAINYAVQAFNNRQEYSMVYGNANITDENNQLIMPFNARYVKLSDLFRKCPLSQPAVFMKKKMLDELGGLDEKLDFCMDYDLWIRIAKNGYKMGKIPAVLANSRFYRESKSGSKYAEIGFPEIIRTSQKHFGAVSRTWMKMFLLSFRNKGLFWFLNLFRTTSLFKKSPSIIISSQKKSEEYSFNISDNSIKALSAIAIEVSTYKHDKLVLYFHLNGELIKTEVITREPAVLLIPCSSNNGKKFIVTSNKKGFSIKDFAALSIEELIFAEAFNKGESGVIRWINQNFKYA